MDKKKNKKKSGGGVKVVALVLLCAVVSGLCGFGGALLADRVGRGDATIHQSDRRPTDVVVQQVDGKTLMNPAQVYASTVNSVVSINCSAMSTNIFGQRVESASSGSGFIITADGYIVTNYHVIKNASSITVTLYSGETYPASLVGGDADYDLAVLKVEATGLKHVTLGDSAKVNVGDTVLVQGVSLRVQALSHQDSNRVQYVSLKTMPALGASSIGCFLCRVDSADQQRLMEALSERDDYVLAVFTDVLRSSTERLHATYDMSAWILTSFAIVIGALVVFNVMQANMLERRRELCVLRTLGFSHRELSRSLLWQTVLYVAFACALGFPAGKLVALSALELISSPDRTFAYANDPVEYAITLAIVLLYAVASHVIAMRSMRAWDINEGVKDKE
jgi:ABC-type antimicrobial peptide transport system permease subunit